MANGAGGQEDVEGSCKKVQLGTVTLLDVDKTITVVLPRVYYSQRRKIHGSLITNLLNIKLMEC